MLQLPSLSIYQDKSQTSSDSRHGKVESSIGWKELRGHIARGLESGEEEGGGGREGQRERQRQREILSLVLRHKLFQGYFVNTGNFIIRENSLTFKDDRVRLLPETIQVADIGIDSVPGMRTCRVMVFSFLYGKTQAMSANKIFPRKPSQKEPSSKRSPASHSHLQEGLTPGTKLPVLPPLPQAFHSDLPWLHDGGYPYPLVRAHTGH